MTAMSTEREVSGLSQPELWDRPAEVRGFSLWQPWASLVALGVKTIETRSWSTKYRGPLMIHASKRPPEVGQWFGSWCVSQHRNGRAIHSYPPPRETPGWYLMPLGAFVATCNLVDVLPIYEPGERIPVAWQRHVAYTGRDNNLWIWEGPGDTEVACTGRPPWVHTDITNQGPFGDFTSGRFAWLLDDIQRVEPIPAKGHQGLWKVDPATSQSAVHVPNTDDLPRDIRPGHLSEQEVRE